MITSAIVEDPPHPKRWFQLISDVFQAQNKSRTVVYSKIWICINSSRLLWPLLHRCLFLWKTHLATSEKELFESPTNTIENWGTRCVWVWVCMCMCLWVCECSYFPCSDTRHSGRIFHSGTGSNIYVDRWGRKIYLQDNWDNDVHRLTLVTRVSRNENW